MTPKKSTFLHLFQSAALALCQFLVAESRSPHHSSYDEAKVRSQSPAQVDATTASTSFGNAIPSTSSIHKSIRSKRGKVQSVLPLPPPGPVVQQLMDMGFARRSIEAAVRALGGASETTPSPESLVGWLLEHQDQVVDQSDDETGSSVDAPVDSDSISDDMDDIEGAFQEVRDVWLILIFCILGTLFLITFFIDSFLFHFNDRFCLMKVVLCTGDETIFLIMMIMLSTFVITFFRE